MLTAPTIFPVGALGAGAPRKKVKTLSLVINNDASAERTFFRPFLILTPSRPHVSQNHLFSNLKIEPLTFTAFLLAVTMINSDVYESLNVDTYRRVIIA